MRAGDSSRGVRISETESCWLHVFVSLLHTPTVDFKKDIVFSSISQLGKWRRRQVMVTSSSHKPGGGGAGVTPQWEGHGAGWGTSS